MVDLLLHRVGLPFDVRRRFEKDDRRGAREALSAALSSPKSTAGRVNCVAAIVGNCVLRHASAATDFAHNIHPSLGALLHEPSLRRIAELGQNYLHVPQSMPRVVSVSAEQLVLAVEWVDTSGGVPCSNVPPEPPLDLNSCQVTGIAISKGPNAAKGMQFAATGTFPCKCGQHKWPFESKGWTGDSWPPFCFDSGQDSKTTPLAQEPLSAADAEKMARDSIKKTTGLTDDDLDKGRRRRRRRRSGVVLRRANRYHSRICLLAVRLYVAV